MDTSEKWKYSSYAGQNLYDESFADHCLYSDGLSSFKR